MLAQSLSRGFLWPWGVGRLASGGQRFPWNYNQKITRACAGQCVFPTRTILYHTLYCFTVGAEGWGGLIISTLDQCGCLFLCFPVEFGPGRISKGCRKGTSRYLFPGSYLFSLHLSTKACNSNSLQVPGPLPLQQLQAWLLTVTVGSHRPSLLPFHPAHDSSALSLKGMICVTADQYRYVYLCYWIQNSRL